MTMHSELAGHAAVGAAAYTRATSVSDAAGRTCWPVPFLEDRLRGNDARQAGFVSVMARHAPQAARQVCAGSRLAAPLALHGASSTARSIAMPSDTFFDTRTSSARPFVSIPISHTASAANAKPRAPRLFSSRSQPAQTRRVLAHRSPQSRACRPAPRWCGRECGRRSSRPA